MKQKHFQGNKKVPQMQDFFDLNSTN